MASADDARKNDQIVKELIVSYWMELETIQNYIAASTNLTGIRAQESGPRPQSAQARGLMNFWGLRPDSCA